MHFHLAVNAGNSSSSFYLSLPEIKKIKECEVLCGQWMAVLRKPESSWLLYHIEEDSRNAMGDENVLFSV